MDSANALLRMTVESVDITPGKACHQYLATVVVPGLNRDNFVIAVMLAEAAIKERVALFVTMGRGRDRDNPNALRIWFNSCGSPVAGANALQRMTS